MPTLLPNATVTTIPRRRGLEVAPATVDPVVEKVLAEFEGNFGCTFFFLCRCSETTTGARGGGNAGFTSYEEIAITRAMRGRWGALGREED